LFRYLFAFALALLCSSLAHAQSCMGSALLTWNPPTQNTDGTALTNLAGFKAYWGLAQGNYPNNQQITNPAAASYQVTNLCAGVWFFVVTAYNAAAVESAFSNVATKTISAEPTAPARPTDITTTPMPPATFTTVLSTRIGYLGDSMVLATPAVPTATRYEWELTHYENKVVDATTTTVPTRLFTATRNGHWTPRVRACNAIGCSAWLSSIDKGYWLHFWIKPPTF
jgi:hypothetical protein